MSEGRGAHHVVQQNVREFGQGKQVCFRRAEGVGKCGEGFVGGCKDREWSFTAQRTCQVGFQHGSFEDGVDVAVDDDVHHRVRERVEDR